MEAMGVMSYIFVLLRSSQGVTPPGEILGIKHRTQTQLKKNSVATSTLGEMGMAIDIHNRI